MSEHSLNSLDLIAEITSIASGSRGIRTDCGLIIERLKEILASKYGFVCLYQPESGRLDVIAATGIEAAVFRRLERRAATTALMRVFDRVEPVTMLVNDEPTLDFLADQTRGATLTSIPILLASECVGSISLAFDSPKTAASNEIVKLLEVVAAV
ncbi:MAG TPA: hypothetical protein VHQ01_07765, partial [Pyrinomonadaceae bacterium]|nr:hypothetical protein [Pyrinomonadaceae bacterium]